VAELNPVEVAGAVIQRATLHNVDFVETLGVSKGDEVMVIRSGDVIPKITKVTSHGTDNLILPTQCPSCGSNLERLGVNLVCTGVECRERDIQKIRHWIRTIDIIGLGPRNIEKLYDLGVVKHFSDLYNPKLSESKLVNLLGKNGAKIFRNIQHSRNLPFYMFLAGLGIENLGLQMAKILTKHFKTWEELEKAKKSDLTLIEGISDITATTILEGINDHSLGKRLLNQGIEIIYTSKERKRVKPSKSTLMDFIGDEKVKPVIIKEKSSEEISRKGTVYVTGKIPDLTKKKTKELLEKYGYEWASLTKSLDLLVIGENPGKNKVEKAKKYGILIETWEEFYKKLD
jgi:DNA ligase (NAD+)